MRMSRMTVLVILTLCITTVGCFSVKAPEKIEVNAGSDREPIDPNSVPPTHSHEEARRELVRAYEEIRYLQSRNDRLERRVRELQSRRD